MKTKESEQYEALLIWVKAIDAAAVAAQARINATLVSKRAVAREEWKSGRGEWAAPVSEELPNL